MACRALVPLVLLALVTARAVELWQAGELDPFTVALVPVAAAMTWWLVRQPGCESGSCPPGLGRSAEGRSVEGRSVDGAAQEEGERAPGEPAGDEIGAAAPGAVDEVQPAAPARR